MPKFRTMKTGSPVVAMHLLANPAGALTPSVPSCASLASDEIPQLISIFRGDMHFVGPRLTLYNQDDLIAVRNQADVRTLLPGLTGWARVNGRDQLSIPDKVALGREYLEGQGLFMDIRILVMSFFKVIGRTAVQH